MNLTDDPRLTAGVDLIGRTGATNFRIGHTDEEEDGLPVIWHATASYGARFDVAAGPGPLSAVMRLCEQLVDGGECTHCGKLTIFTADIDPGILPTMGCVYSFDPELSTFRRGCE